AQRLQDKGEKIGWEKGLEQGLEQGIEKGREEERLLAHQRQLDMARNLLKNGVSLDLIIESTGLSREELISLQ
ncbi:TPA: transposase, partial [Providencia rettgeri]|nr:transposase [Providencia rettgeri]